jgi:hypothetical protein
MLHALALDQVDDELPLLSCEAVLLPHPCMTLHLICTALPESRLYTQMLL